MITKEEKFIQCFHLSLDELKSIVQEAVQAIQIAPSSEKPNSQISDYPEIEEDLMTRAEVMDCLSVSAPTLWRYDKKGVLKIKNKIGRRIYYSRRDLRNLINNKA